jgi:tetratricopeptide (TPR) repeat protein
VAGIEAETGITLLHLGSLLADEGDVAASLSALHRALSIASTSGDPLARGLALTAILLAEWKGGDLEAARQAGDAAMELFEALGHRTMEGTVAYRLAAVNRGLQRPDASRVNAQRAIDAGSAASTRTTVALGHLGLARLDMDDRDLAAASAHLEAALDGIDATADRWVLVDALEGVARLLLLLERPGGGRLLSTASALRAEIGQPVPQTDVADLAATRAGIADTDPRESALTAIVSALDAHRVAVEALRAASRVLTS